MATSPLGPLLLRQHLIRLSNPVAVWMTKSHHQTFLARDLQNYAISKTEYTNT
jgi:hypothetical protein